MRTLLAKVKFMYFVRRTVCRVSSGRAPLWRLGILFGLLSLLGGSQSVGSDHGALGIGAKDNGRRAKGALSAEDLEYFEARVRPLLVESCYECHSAGARRIRGGLLLDHAEGWRIGGDSGLAIVPGDPEGSLLIRAVLHQDEHLTMPPSGKLSETKVAILVEWVRRGAPDPRTDVAGEGRRTSPAKANEGWDHWAYKPVVKPALPAVQWEDWVRQDVDRHILVGIEAAGIEPAPEANREQLVRRLYHDLIGLPPTPDELEMALKDEGMEAIERLVDRLLASPHFGERWGRHWLDVVRFGESLTLRGFVLPEAWRYRDYVIQSFNEDRPYGQFIREQVAGDLIEFAEPLLEEERDRSQAKRIATTFWMLGNFNLEEQDKNQLDMDIVDEQLDTLGKVFLGQTLGCARCHDHKFDPISTKDYYALAGILASCQSVEHANVSKWLEFPLPVTRKDAAEMERHAELVAGMQAGLKEAKGRLEVLESKAGLRGGGGIVAARDLPGIVVDDTEAEAVGEWMESQHHTSYVGTGYRHDKNEGKGKKTLTFHPNLPGSGSYAVRLAYTPGENRAPRVPVTVLHSEGESTVYVNQRTAPPLDGHFVLLGEFKFERGNQGYVLVSNEGTEGHVIVDAVQFLRLDDTSSGVRLADDSAGSEAAGRLHNEIREASALVARLERELKDAMEQGPRVERYMSLTERENPRDLPVHIRGSVHQQGPIVERGIPEVLSGGFEIVMPADRSGRIEMAEWLASSGNPLTARVIVNRVWHWLFGAGLVRTPDNFGTTGEAPTHPELLDHLAVEFLESGGSIKSLLRGLVLSGTYRQSTVTDPRWVVKDPDNRLWGRMNRRRMDAETLRDALLQVAGRLDRNIGGRVHEERLASDYDYVHRDTRRSVYSPVFRNALPDLFRVFDFADPSMVTGARNVSTVATQALFLMNNPFVIDQARSAAQELIDAPLTTDAKIDLLYVRALGRAPHAGERMVLMGAVADDFTGENGASIELERWTQAVQAVFGSPDFRHIE